MCTVNKSQYSPKPVQADSSTLLEYLLIMGFSSCSAVKNSPAMQKLQEMWVYSLGREDLLKGGMATHSSILA